LSASACGPIIIAGRRRAVRAPDHSPERRFL
jgi:hypothetical protein